MGRKGQRKRSNIEPEEVQAEVVSSEAYQEELREEDPSVNENVLTSIPLRIHCPATTDVEDSDELDEIAIENFLDTLSEVALSIASRKLRPEPVQGLASHRQDRGEIA